MKKALEAARASTGTAPEPQLVYHRIAPPTSWSNVSLAELWAFRDTESPARRGDDEVWV